MPVLLSHKYSLVVFYTPSSTNEYKYFFALTLFQRMVIVLKCIHGKQKGWQKTQKARTEAAQSFVVIIIQLLCTFIHEDHSQEVCLYVFFLYLTCTHYLFLFIIVLCSLFLYNTRFAIFRADPKLATRTFQMFRCVDLGEKIGQLLDADFSKQCFEGVHADYVPFAIFSVVFYLVGLPLGTFVVLFLNRKRLDQPQIESKYGDLYRQYDNEWYFWECLLMIQKCFLTGKSCFVVVWLLLCFCI